MENNQNTNSSSKISLAKIFFFNWKIILIVSLIGIILGVSLSVVRNRVTYKASKSVMLITKMAYSDIDLDNAITGDIINDVFEQIKSDKYVSSVNKYYNDGFKVSKNAISISRSNEDTFIFTITYTASNPEDAKEGLEKIIDFSNKKVLKKTTYTEGGGESFVMENFFEYHTVADTINVKEVQRDARVKETTTLVKNIVISVIVSVVLAVGIAFIIGIMDNTVSDKEQLEEITGTNLLAFIEDTDLPVKKKKNK